MKTYDDERPRISRQNDLLLPMQQIVMDVKVIDCVVKRSDGTIAWPRMVAFMDTATQRLFRRFFLLGPSEGIRQEHVARVFLEMVSDQAWGFPQQLYRDNGSEFLILDMVRTALDQLQTEGVPTIINARPYSAASKPIESKFAMLDRFVFSQMPGWAGCDRMHKKSARLGALPIPYPGSFDDFVSEADERITVFEDNPIGSGPFAGKSPRQLFADHVSKGWGSLLVCGERLDAAFCTRGSRRVSRGSIKIAGARYRHSDLINGQRLSVALPWRRNSRPLAFIPERGWVTLEEDLPFAPMDRRGARESETRRREYNASTERLRVAAGNIDLEANRRDRLAALSDNAAPKPIIDLDIFPGEEALASALAASTERDPGHQMSSHRKRMAETEELEGYIANLSS